MFAVLFHIEILVSVMGLMGLGGIGSPRFAVDSDYLCHVVLLASIKKFGTGIAIGIGIGRGEISSSFGTLLSPRPYPNRCPPTPSPQLPFQCVANYAYLVIKKAQVN